MAKPNVAPGGVGVFRSRIYNLFCSTSKASHTDGQTEAVSPSQLLDLNSNTQCWRYSAGQAASVWREWTGDVWIVTLQSDVAS